MLIAPLMIYLGALITLSGAGKFATFAGSILTIAGVITFIDCLRHHDLYDRHLD